MYCLVTYVEHIYELSLTFKKNMVYVSFRAKYMPIIGNFVISGGHYEFL